MDKGPTSTSGRAKSKIRQKGDGWDGWGGYMAAKKAKLNEQFLDRRSTTDGQVSDIFRGVIIHVDGYTKPSSDELKRLMMLHGGHYQHYLSKRRVTHIIATNLPNSKITKHLKHCKVVKPEWIVDSVQAGRLLSYVPYLLFTSQSRIQPGLNTFATSTVVRQTTVDRGESTVNACSDGGTEESESSLMPAENSEAEPSGNGGLSDIDENEIDNFFKDSSDEDENKSTDEFNEEANVLKQQKLDTDQHNIEQVIPSDICTLEKDRSVSSMPPGNKQLVSKSTVSLSKPALRVNNSNKSSEVVSNNNKTNFQNKARKSSSPAKAGDPQYLNEFYNHSRLHHLSTWKTEWRVYVSKLQKEGSEFPGRQRLIQQAQKKLSRLGQGNQTRTVGKPERVIMHVDMDCFFVSVGLRKRPELRGKPVAVTHSKGQGQKEPPPGSDLAYEKMMWELKKQKGHKKGQGKSPQGQTAGTSSYVDEGFMEEEETESSERGGAYDKIDIPTAATEYVYSMSEIASCSYEARQAGVKNGMFMGPALKLCPDLVTIPYDFDGYQEVSRCLYDTVASYTHDIEAVSCDEMLVDCTDLLAVTAADPLDFASLLRSEIYEKTGCTASAGIGSSILLAKMATQKAKPNGQYHLKTEAVMGFMENQSVKNIPGVGWSMTKKLQSLNVSTCGELQKVSLSVLQKEFGPKTGQSLYRYCRGEDDRPVKMDQERKSVSAEINYGIRFEDDTDADKFLKELSEEVHNRLRNIDMKGKTITLKVMVRRQDAPKETAKFMGHGICNNISKSTTLPIATDDPKIIHKEVSGILRNLRVVASDLRGIGIQVQRLESAFIGLKAAKTGQSILNFTVSKPAIYATSDKAHTPDEDVASSSTCTTAVKFTVQPGVLNMSQNTKYEDEKLMQLESGCSADMIENHGGKPSDRTSPVLNDTCSAAQASPSSKSSKQLETTDSSSFDRRSFFPEESQSMIHDVEMTDALSLENNITGNAASNKEKSERSSDFLEGAVCQNLVDELSRRKTANRFLPPLPTLEFSSPPEITNDPPMPDLDREDGALLPENNSTTMPMDYFPSPSQIDPEVLKELPSDIRNQIVEDMNAIKRKNSTSRPPDEVHPGCSHWTSPEEQSANENEVSSKKSLQTLQKPNQSADYGKLTEADILPLPSPSQLDESCLHALPPELQQEIMEAYSHQTHGQKNTVTTNKSPSRSSSRSPGRSKASPRKAQGSPGHTKKNSPVFKVPKGKAARGRPKKLDFRDREQPRIDSVENYGQKFAQKEKGKATQTPTVVQPPTVMKDPSTEVTPSDQPSDGIPAQNGYTTEMPVNLCGAVSIQDVRELLREWLQQSPEPVEEDENTMVGYLNQLITSRNLEQLDLVVKFLNRKVKQLASLSWQQALERILTEAQNTMKSFYGGTLKIV